MENTKQTKLEKEVNDIINSNMTVREKMTALNAIETTGRPGAAKAVDAIRAYRYHIAELRRSLPCSRSDYRSSRLDNLGTIYGNVIMFEYLWRNKDFSNIEYYTGIDDSISRQLRDLSFNICDVADPRKEMVCRLKQAGRILAPLMIKWRNETKPMVAAYDKENADFMAEYHVRKYRSFADYVEGNTAYTTLADACKDKPCLVGDYCLVAVEDESRDWNYYSKAWHRAHGPKITVESRSVRIIHKGKETSVEVKAFRQGVFAEVLAAHLGIEKPVVPTDLRRLQTNKWFGVKKSVKRNGIQVYKQTFGTMVAGYVAEDGDGNTYHADSIDRALSGLSAKVAKMKQEAAKEAATAYTAMMLHNRFGFCFAGMKEFCHAVDLDIDGTYSIAQLKEAVRTHNCTAVLRKYHRELTTAKIIA